MSQLEKKLPPTPPRRSVDPATASPLRASGSSITPAPAVEVKGSVTPTGISTNAFEELLLAERQRYEKLLSERIAESERRLQEVLVAEIARQVAQLKLEPPVSNKTSLRELVNRLYADRPKEKREAWTKRLEDQEILTVEAAARLDDNTWLRLDLPLGVTETLKEQVRAAAAKSAGNTPSALPPPVPTELPSAAALLRAKQLRAQHTRRDSAPALLGETSEPKVIEFADQAPVQLTRTTATTKSGCPHSPCDAEFEMSYDSTTNSYSPKHCYKCRKELHPPKRLKIVAKENLGARKKSDVILTRLTSVAAKSGIRTASSYIPFAGNAVAAVGESAVDIAAEEHLKGK